MMKGTPIITGTPRLTLKGLRVVRDNLPAESPERRRLDIVIEEKEERARAFLSAHGLRAEKG